MTNHVKAKHPEAYKQALKQYPYHPAVAICKLMRIKKIAVLSLEQVRIRKAQGLWPFGHWNKYSFKGQMSKRIEGDLRTTKRSLNLELEDC